MPSRLASGLLVIVPFLSVLLSLEGCVDHLADQAFQRGGNKRSGAAAPHLYAQYEIVLVAVERPSQAEARYGEMVVTQADSSTVSVNVAEDQLVKLIWLPPERRIPFVLLNKSEQSVTLLWHDVAYVDVLHRTHNAIHAGAQVSDPRVSQMSSVVFSKDRLADFIAPAEGASFGRSHWNLPPLFPCTKGFYCDQPLALAYKGLTYQVHLPLQVGPDTFPYIFTFQVNQVEIRNDQENGPRKAPDVPS